jgi:hypothetical protein
MYEDLVQVGGGKMKENQMKIEKGWWFSTVWVESKEKKY